MITSRGCRTHRLRFNSYPSKRFFTAPMVAPWPLNPPILICFQVLISLTDSNSSNEEIEAVSVETKLVEKEVAEEVKVTTPLPTVEVVEEKEDVVEVGRSESSPAPLERLKGWMDERDAQENFESSIEEFKAKLAAAQDALIVLQDQLEQSKRKKNSQK